MVKTLFRRDRSDEQTEADPFANGHASENGAAANDSADGGVTPPVETPVQEAPTGPTCATCGAPIQDGQDWCLDCGTALAHGGRGWQHPGGRRRHRPRLRDHVHGGRIRRDLRRRPEQRHRGGEPAAGARRPPAPPAPAPAASTPPPAAPKAPKAPNTTAPPPASTPAPVPATPVPATPVPATPVPVPSTSGGSTSSGSCGSTGSSAPTRPAPAAAAPPGSSNSGGDDLKYPIHRPVHPGHARRRCPGIYDPFGDGQQNAADVFDLTNKDKRQPGARRSTRTRRSARAPASLHAHRVVGGRDAVQIRTPEPGLSVNIYGSKDPPTRRHAGRLAQARHEDRRIGQAAHPAQDQRHEVPPLPGLDHEAARRPRTSATISELELFS